MQVKEAIDLISTPSDPERRRNAILWLQQLKSDTGNCEVNADLAFQFILSTTTDDVSTIHYRLFGLQLLESIIGHSWNSLSVQTKASVRSRLLDLVIKNDLNQNILLNALVKCVVNVMIRDWPQKWPDLTTKLFGSPCNRTVLLVLWRITEDVGVLMIPDNSDRRRELLAALNDNVAMIFNYIGQSVQSPDMTIALTSLKALTGILEWSPIDESLCDFLCNIVVQDSWDEESIEAKAVSFECISLILNRKHRNMEEKRIILTFFKEHNFSKFVSCLRLLVTKTTQPPCFSLLSLARNVSSVFNSCGQQLLAVGVTEIPETTFHTYLDQMISIFHHPSPSVHSIPVNFFKEIIKRKAVGKELALKLFASIPTKLIKRSEEDIFVRCDFDTYQDYEQSFYKIRAEILHLLRILAANEDDTIFTASISLLDSFLNGHDDRWEALTFILDAVFNNISEPEKFQIPSLQLIHRLLSSNLPSNCHEANILSFQLSCISALLVFMKNQPTESFLPLLSHVFKLTRFPSEVKSEDAKNVRRHAASFFVKLSKMYPQALEVRTSFLSPLFILFFSFSSSSLSSFLSPSLSPLLHFLLFFLPLFLLFFTFFFSFSFSFSSPFFLLSFTLFSFLVIYFSSAREFSP